MKVEVDCRRFDTDGRCVEVEITVDGKSRVVHGADEVVKAAKQAHDDALGSKQ